MRSTFPERIATARTLLRAWRIGDGPDLKQGLDHNAAELAPWVPWATGEVVPLDAAEERVRRCVEEFVSGANFTWAIRSPDEAVLLGGAGLHPRIGPGGVEIGYWVDRGHTGRGIATEVARALVAVGFGSPGVDRIEIHCDRRNTASARIPARLGFTLVGLDDRGNGGAMMTWRLLRDQVPGGPGAR